MSVHFAGWNHRTLDLALTEVTTGLAGPERAELAAAADARDIEALELAIAELNVAGLGELEAPPAALMRRIAAGARARFPLSDIEARTPERRAMPEPARRQRPALFSIGGWLIAACVLVALALHGLLARAPSPVESRERLLATAKDLVQAPWKPSEDPLASGLTGEVVWSRARQEGYMRFRSLAPNDPRRQQYQLWIFDPTRAEWEAKPVDGGVFDIGPGVETVVPVDAKLDVRQVALFAVTLEAPGGVVVSKREHLLATATP